MMDHGWDRRYIVRSEIGEMNSQRMVSMKIAMCGLQN